MRAIPLTNKDNALRLIKRTLRAAGKPMANTVLLQKAAGDLAAYIKTADDVDNLQSSFYSVVTREGSTKFKLHPAVEHLPELSSALDKSLDAIGLTRGALDEELSCSDHEGCQTRPMRKSVLK